MFKTSLVVFITLIFSINCYSEVKIWDGEGTDNNWRTPANWNNDVAPMTDDDLIFPANSEEFTTNNDFPLFTNFNSITIEGGNYLISGNPFRLMAELVVKDGNHRINTIVTLLSPLTFTADQGSTTRITTVDFGDFYLEIEGSGTFDLESISGSGKIEKNGLGTSFINSAGRYTGSININDGNLIVDANMPNTSILVDSQNLNSATSISGLSGTGTALNVYVLNGKISAGKNDSIAGVLTANTDFIIQEDGIVEVKIGGENPGHNGYDQFIVNGSVRLNNSILKPVFINNFQPKINDSFLIIDNKGNLPVSGTFLNAPEGARLGGTSNTAFIISYRGGDGNDVVLKAVNRSTFDFDGDGKSNISNFNPTNGYWNVLNSNSSNSESIQFGLAEDKLVPADFDGDSKTDIAVFRPANGIWYILNSTDFTVQFIKFGLSEDIPMPNDFDGDGRADIAVFRPSVGIWYQIRSLRNQFVAQQFGKDGDIPLMGDFDGDGKGDLVIYREGFWHLLKSVDNAYNVIQLGIATDIPIPGDFDGDKITDFAVFRGTEDSSKPDFYILNGRDFSFQGASWGIPGDIPVVADYDGDGKTDIAICRPNTNDWYLLQSTNGFAQIKFGQLNEIPIPSVFN